MEIIIILITLLCMLVGYWYLIYKYNSRHITNYPGPTPLPILGNSMMFLKFDKILPIVTSLYKAYGKSFKLSIPFADFRILTTDVNLLEFVLTNTKILNKGKEYRFMHSWLGDGLLTSTGLIRKWKEKLFIIFLGAKWKRHRKMITPAFHFQILEQFIDIFDNYSNILVDNLRKEVNKKSVDIYPYITLCDLDIICATSMGTKVNAQINSESEYVQSVKEACRIFVEKTTKVVKRSALLYPFTKDYEIEKRALKVLHDYTNAVIKSRTDELSNNESNSEIIFDEFVKKKKTLLDTLIEYKNQHHTITEEEMREEVDTFMFAGHDTTTSAISFTLYSLAQYPDIQEKVVEELKTIFRDNFYRPATYADLQNMKYLEKVIKESLRLYPPVPLFGRSLSEDVPSNNGILPKGVNVTISAFNLHRDPHVFPNPDKFDPERFSSEKQSKRSPYTYIPFSAGSRNCIGQKFAILEVKAVISKILKNFEVTCCQNHKLVLIFQLILKSSTGVHVCLKDRKI